MHDLFGLKVLRCILFQAMINLYVTVFFYRHFCDALLSTGGKNQIESVQNS